MLEGLGGPHVSASLNETSLKGLCPKAHHCPRCPIIGRNAGEIKCRSPILLDRLEADDSWLEQAQRVDELIARVEAGQALAPVPVALTRFYDAIEARVRDLEEDPEILRTERQILQVLGSLGMVPDSAVPFVEALDENEIELCAQQVIGFSRLPRLHGEEARQAAHALAERTVELSLRHKDLALAVLDDLPGGVAGRTLWHLTRVLFASGYPDPAQQAFAARLLELLLTSPDLAATFRRSVGEDPVR